MLKHALLALAVFVAPLAASAQTAIHIDRNAPTGTIQPEIYGQFVEHLGSQIYDGIWVGPDSDIPNTDGIRNDVFAALDALDIPVIRWPGGCFADEYHWRDGIGPERTPRVNMSWGETPEPNSFGTHEFFDLAERLGAKTYLNVNLGSGSVREAAEWLEYISSASNSALAQERRANGRDKPWHVDYLSIGNETWGCGGNMRPEYYADLYLQWATLIKIPGEQPYRILSGSNDTNPEYSAQLLRHPQMGWAADAVSLHYYTLPTGDWSTKGPATGFGEAQWISTIANALKIEPIIERQLAANDAAAGDDPPALAVDEWGMWVDGEPGDPALYQQNGIRDAIVAALHLNVFHAHADRIAMTNIAQMVNVLQAMILTDGPRMVLTPTYHVYAMYRPFQGAAALPVSLESPEYRLGNSSVPALSASAAIPADGGLVVALINADAHADHAVTLDVGSGRLVSARVLAGDAMDAHNSFEAPDAVSPRPIDVARKGSEASLRLPPRSVTVLRFE
ncbi:alpha-N-arabinofuranosidase [Stakelama tenebrarum]|uniref:non-reducing end alpha-L-arabinofuranosidase n=1 Tax=Stakelama tenebrarum TaxID=2711215 RepID=A0A6G6Y944_9SPHN|nr:alpha-L-arabinofuranosidase C-terminal domain-containing protein [Sphingosinithalassobacter tenebrarum]QIG81439.1 alpha-N-arabinofuranosidase [Sphingosinithalassobacter tenebrarum]